MLRVLAAMVIAALVVAAVALGPDWGIRSNFDGSHPRPVSDVGFGVGRSAGSGDAGASGGGGLDGDEESCRLERRFPGFSGVYLDDQQRPVVNFTHGVRPRVK